MKRIVLAIITISLLCACAEQPEVATMGLDFREGMVYRNGEPFTGRAVDDRKFSKRVSHYRNGLKHGPHRVYDEHGELMVDSDYENNIPLSFQKYHSDGTLWIEKKYRDGTQVLEFKYHRNGQLHMRTEFTDNLMDGQENEYRENGSLFRSVVYKAGYKEGIENYYDFDGETVARVVRYENGQRQDAPN